jgi:hypothetical protein
MCVSYCHRRNLLYWNHESCADFDCPFVAEAHRPCTICRHRLDEQCGLTRGPLPADSGCCHYELELAQGPQEISVDMVEPLIVGRPTSVTELLDDFEVPYQVSLDGQTLTVDPDDLVLPLTYGVPTEAFYEEEFEWPEVTW